MKISKWLCRKEWFGENAALDPPLALPAQESEFHILLLNPERETITFSGAQL